MVRQMGQTHDNLLTPMMLLQDPEKTKVIIVTLAETTPVLEAANLQQDLRRAEIEPWAWVINSSLAAAKPSSPFLVTRASRELPLINDVTEQFAERIALSVGNSDNPEGRFASASCSRCHIAAARASCSASALGSTRLMTRY